MTPMDADKRRLNGRDEKELVRQDMTYDVVLRFLYSRVFA